MASNTKYQEERAALWTAVWVAVSRSTSAVDAHVCTAWADRAVHEFDQRFQPEHGTMLATEKVKAEMVAEEKAKVKKKGSV